MTDTTARWYLPLLAAGQAQKEMTHNEALTALDLLIQPVVLATGLDVPPTGATPGQCWIVGTAPTGAWAGQAGAVAGWTDGGWRFAPPREGMSAWSVADGGLARRLAGTWRIAPRPVVADPAGGTTTDLEARAAIAAILAALRAHGLLAGQL